GHDSRSTRRVRWRNECRAVGGSQLRRLHDRKYDGSELLIHRITHMLPPGIWDILGIYTRPRAPYTGERTFSNLQAPSTGRQTGHDGRIAGGTRRGILAGSGLILHDHCAIGPWPDRSGPDGTDGEDRFTPAPMGRRALDRCRWSIPIRHRGPHPLDVPFAPDRRVLASDGVGGDQHRG